MLDCISALQPLYALESFCKQAGWCILSLIWSERVDQTAHSFRPETFCCGQKKKKKRERKEGQKEGTEKAEKAWSILV